jgi:hypothetical protein
VIRYCLFGFAISGLFSLVGRKTRYLQLHAGTVVPQQTLSMVSSRIGTLAHSLSGGIDRDRISQEIRAPNFTRFDKPAVGQYLICV